jgi:hypothetical protein
LILAVIGNAITGSLTRNRRARAQETEGPIIAEGYLA